MVRSPHGGGMFELGGNVQRNRVVERGPMAL
jgi:hypothetical protein